MYVLTTARTITANQPAGPGAAQCAPRTSHQPATKSVMDAVT